MKNKIKLFCTCILIAFITITGKTSYAQDEEEETTNEFETRTEFGLSYKAFKKLKFNFAPQLRFDESFSLDKYLFELGAEYKASKLFDLEATYRYVINPRDTKDTEYFNRYSFSATAHKKFDRFESAFRLRYSNDADDENEDEEFLRYKGSVEYNIAKCKFTPSAAIEAFQQLGGDGLYKIRYAAGLDYKLNKKNYIGVSYKFDYYKTEYVNKHILSIGYKIKL
jgi:long-subunit fatty acid transport protein